VQGPSAPPESNDWTVVAEQTTLQMKFVIIISSRFFQLWRLLFVKSWYFPGDRCLKSVTLEILWSIIIQVKGIIPTHHAADGMMFIIGLISQLLWPPDSGHVLSIITTDDLVSFSTRRWFVQCYGIAYILSWRECVHGTCSFPSCIARSYILKVFTSTHCSNWTCFFFSSPFRRLWLWWSSACCWKDGVQLNWYSGEVIILLPVAFCSVSSGSSECSSPAFVTGRYWRDPFLQNECFLVGERGPREAIGW